VGFQPPITVARALAHVHARQYVLPAIQGVHLVSGAVSMASWQTSPTKLGSHVGPARRGQARKSSRAAWRASAMR
jgi:hypothetical protein